MEVDELGGDPENQLVTMFSSMATEDKDNLVTALQGVVGSAVSPVSCKFFLELANWNLSAAIGAYYDFDFSQQQQQLNQPPGDDDEAAAAAAAPVDAGASSSSSSGAVEPRLAILSCEASLLHDCAVAVVCTVYNESTSDCPPGCRLVCAPADADAADLCELCQLPGLRAGGNCRLRLLLPPAASASLRLPGVGERRRVRLRLLAPGGTPLSAPAATRCLDVDLDQSLAGAGAVGDADTIDSDAAAAAAAALWASAEPPLTENPPPSPAHNDEQMME